MIRSLYCWLRKKFLILRYNFSFYVYFFRNGLIFKLKTISILAYFLCFFSLLSVFCSYSLFTLQLENLSICYFAVYGGTNSWLGFIMFVFSVLKSNWCSLIIWCCVCFYVFLIFNVFTFRSLMENFVLFCFVIIFVSSVSFSFETSVALMFIYNHTSDIMSFVPLSFFDGTLEIFKYVWYYSEMEVFYEAAGAQYGEYFPLMNKIKIISLSHNDPNLLVYNMDQAYQELTRNVFYRAFKFLAENKKQNYFGRSC